MVEESEEYYQFYVQIDAQGRFLIPGGARTKFEYPKNTTMKMRVYAEKITLEKV